MVVMVKWLYTFDNRGRMTTYTPPVDARITQLYGTNANSYQPGGHTGIDYAVPVGTAVRSIGDGVVRHADWASALGWPNPYYVAIDFDGPSNGDQSAGIVVIIDHGPHVSIYAHLSYTGLNPGDTVKQGQVIGTSGNTGRSSGPHLHFEMLPDGWDVHNNVYGRINPLPLLKNGTGAINPSSTTQEESEVTPAQMHEIKLFIQAEINKSINAMWASDGVIQQQISGLAAGLNRIQAGSVDLEALAKAVNDEAAKRLQK